MKKRFIIALVLTSVLITSCSSDSNKKVTNETTDTVRKFDVVFDVPSLIDKNIDEIILAVGKPNSDDEPTKLQLKEGIDEWEKGFTKNGYELLVTYNPQTREVIDFFVPTNNPSGATSNINELLQVTNVDGNTTLNVMSVKAFKNPNEYTGVRISK